MKRLLIAVAALLACAAFAAAAAAAGGEPTITLHVAPAAPTANQTLTFTSDVSNVESAWVGLYMIKGGTCPTNPDEEETLAEPSTNTTFDATLAAGSYAVTAYVWGEESEWSLASDCTGVTVSPVVPVVPAKPSDEISESFLCWNHEMVDPIAYVDKVADTMWKTGNYFEPQAILGNVVGGTNLGAYHLVCNAPGTMTMTGLGLGGSGEVYSAEVMTLYHQAHPGVNDLNVYHIWK
jgi:hypothetical protein